MRDLQEMRKLFAVLSFLLIYFICNKVNQNQSKNHQAPWGGMIGYYTIEPYPSQIFCFIFLFFSIRGTLQMFHTTLILLDFYQKQPI